MRDSSSLQEEIRSDIHGETISSLACDLYHDQPIPVGTDNVLMDVVKVDNLEVFESLTEPPDGWIADVTRCEGHFTDTVGLPTDGYVEAVVIVDLVDVRRGEGPSEGKAVVDATEMQVLDHSPSEHGADPPPLDAISMMKATEVRDDYGICRISRLRELLPAYRQMGKQVLVDIIQEQISKAKDIAEES